MALKRLDVLVRKNSTVTQDYAVSFTKHFVNNRQERESAAVEYYADLFDSRTKKSWKVYSDKACDIYDINNYYTTADGHKIHGVVTLNTTDLTMQQLFDHIIIEPDDNGCINFDQIPGNFICIWNTVPYKIKNTCIQLLEPAKKVKLFYKKIKS